MAKKPDPAAAVTFAEAEELAGRLMDDMHSDPPALARFCLLLRSLAYHADEDARESLYTATEQRAAPFMRGVDEAVAEQMRIALADIRKGGAR